MILSYERKSQFIQGKASPGQLLDSGLGFVVSVDEAATPKYPVSARCEASLSR